MVSSYSISKDSRQVKRAIGIIKRSRLEVRSFVGLGTKKKRHKKVDRSSWHGGYPVADIAYITYYIDRRLARFLCAEGSSDTLRDIDPSKYNIESFASP